MQVKNMKFKANISGIRAVGLKSPGAHSLTKKTADDVADKAASMAGWAVLRGGDWSKGSLIDARGAMRREDDPTPSRARSAILAQHPNGSKRAAGTDALQASI